MEALAKLTDLIDCIKQILNDDQYVKIMDYIKIIHHHCLKEATMKRIDDNSFCTEHGNHCECDANQKIVSLLNQLEDQEQSLSRYLKIIAEIAADKYYI